MEKNNGLQSVPGTGTSLATSPGSSNLPDIRVIKAVVEFNQLRSFSLTPVEIAEWARTIIRIWPDYDVEWLNFVIDKMKCGQMEYDRGLGIQNIFQALKNSLRRRDGDKNLYFVKVLPLNGQGW